MSIFNLSAYLMGFLHIIDLHSWLFLKRNQFTCLKTQNAIWLCHLLLSIHWLPAVMDRILILRVWGSSCWQRPEGLLLTVGPSQSQGIACHCISKPSAAHTSLGSFRIKGPSPSTWWIPAHPSRFSSYFLLQAFPGISPTPTSLQRNSIFYVLLNILYTCHICLYQETAHYFRAGAVYLKSSKPSGRAR